MTYFPHIYMIWMWDAVYGTFEPQPWPYNITWTSPNNYSSKNPPPPAQVKHWMVHPCAHHSLHIKVLKHFIYIWYACGMWFIAFWRLNHDLTTSLGLQHALNLPKIHPHLHRRNSVRVHPCAHPQHIRMIKHLRDFGASSMTLHHHLDFNMHLTVQNPPPPAHGTL